MKTENILKRLNENGFKSAELGEFKTSRGTFKIRLPYKANKEQFIWFCTKYQLHGIREKNFLYLNYIAS